MIGECPAIVPLVAAAPPAKAAQCSAICAMAADELTRAKEVPHKPRNLRSFQIVVAATGELGIGRGGKLPWFLPSDMQLFKRITSAVANDSKKNAVVMGRGTWESIPTKFRPLPGRANVVLSCSGLELPNALVCSNIDEALEKLASPPFDSNVESVFIIGGGEIFTEAMKSPLCSAIHLTSIEKSFECDTFMQAVDKSSFRLWSASSPVNENDIRYLFLTYVRSGMDDGEIDHSLPKFVRVQHEEYQYLNLIKDIIETGNRKTDRIGTGTISKFVCQ